MIKYKTKKGWKVTQSLLGAVLDNDFTGELEVPAIKINETIDEAVRKENTAWLNHERCTMCGGKKEPDPLMDMCGKCLEDE